MSNESKADPIAATLLLWAHQGQRASMQQVVQLSPLQLVRAPLSRHGCFVRLQAYDALLHTFLTGAQSASLDTSGASAVATLGEWAAASALDLTSAGAFALAASMTSRIALLALSNASSAVDASHDEALTDTSVAGMHVLDASEQMLSRSVTIAALHLYARPANPDAIVGDMLRDVCSMELFPLPPRCAGFFELDVPSTIAHVSDSMCAQLACLHVDSDVELQQTLASRITPSAASVQALLYGLADVLARVQRDRFALTPSVNRSAVSGGLRVGDDGSSLLTSQLSRSKHGSEELRAMIIRAKDACVVLMVTENDAQDVTCCSAQAMLSPDGLNIAVTTKQRGIVLCRGAEALQSPRSGEEGLFGYVFNQVSNSDFVLAKTSATST